MPLSSEHSLTIPVVDADIDELEHANNVAYVRWLETAARAHSEAVGLTFERYRELGGVFVIRRQEVDYLRPVLRGASLKVRTWIESAMAAKCIRLTEIATDDGTVVCKGRTTWGYVELATGRPARIPAEIRAAFALDAPA